MTEPGTAFDRLTQEFITAELAAEPVRASGLGVPGHDDDLPDLTAGGLAARRADARAWRDRFAALADDDLSAEERIDRDLVLATLRKREVMAGDWQDWRRYPDMYSGPVLQGVFVLFLHGLRPERELIASAVSRLTRAGELLAAGRENLDPELVAPVLVRRAAGQARGAVAYLRGSVAESVGDADGHARLAEAGERAAAEFEAYAGFLDDLAGRAGGDFALGEERYSTLLREAEGLAYGSAGLHQRGERAYAELAADMRRRAKEIDGDEDWRALLERLNADHPATPEEMRTAYADWTARARAFGYEHDLVGHAEGEECAVDPSPPFQRAMLAVASYSAPPMFTDRRRGTFFVPYPPHDATAEQVQQRLATNSHHSMPSIAVHEAYPGHHWHLSWVAAHCRRPLRKMFGTPYFSEGWALYAEQMYAEQGFFTDPRHELCQVDARLFRAARIVVDTALHAGDMSVDEAITFMSTKASLSRETATAEVARYCAWPTQAAAYLTGALEIQRMRDEWTATRRGSLRAFHDRIAASGMLPIGLAERALSVPDGG